MKGKDPKKGAGKDKKVPAPANTGVDERRAARNVDRIREKLSTAMDDPHMREQIVRAMRSLINEDKS